MRKYLAALALSLSAALATGACAPGRLYVRIAPPVPLVEARIVAPGPDYVWIPGYHRWDGRAYVWVAGSWALPPVHYHAWVTGHWVHRGNRGWYWVDGHWRR